MVMGAWWTASLPHGRALLAQRDLNGRALSGQFWRDWDNFLRISMIPAAAHIHIHDGL